MYLKEKSWYEQDMNIWKGFQWIDASNAKQHIFIFERIGLDDDDRTIVILNFGKEEIENFKLGVNVPGKYEEVLNSNELKFGGTGTCINDKVVESKYVYEGEEVSDKESSKSTKSKSKSLKSKVNDIISNVSRGDEIKSDNVSDYDRAKDAEKITRDESKKVHGRENYIEVKIPKLSAVILKLKT